MNAWDLWGLDEPKDAMIIEAVNGRSDVRSETGMESCFCDGLSVFPVFLYTTVVIEYLVQAQPFLSRFP